MRACGAESQNALRDAASLQPALEKAFEDGNVVLRVVASAVDDQHTSLLLASRLDDELVDCIAGFFAQQSPVVLWGLGGVLAVLTLAVGIAALLPVLRPAGDFTNLRQRIASWWVMIALLAGALLAGWQVFTTLMIAISFVALREFLSLARCDEFDAAVG